MKSKTPRFYWTKELVLKSAKEYTTKAAWSKGDTGAYSASCRNNWHVEACSHMVVKAKLTKAEKAENKKACAEHYKKNHYKAYYERTKAKRQTPEYKEMRKEVCARYVRNNPEKRTESINKYARSDKGLARSKKYYAENRDQLLEKNKIFYEENKDRILLSQRRWYEENKEQVAEYQKKYNEKNKEKIAERGKNWREENKEILQVKSKKYRQENKDKCKIRDAKYYENNKEEFSRKGKIYRENNPVIKFFSHTMERLRLLDDHFSSIDIKDEIINVGYTHDQLEQHIENHFEEGMSWDNRSEWHIDHIRPIILFVEDGEFDFSIINALSNLRPLWAFDNRSKRNKYDPEIHTPTKVHQNVYELIK